MEKNKDDFKRIFKIILFAVVLFWISNNFSSIGTFLSKGFNMILPFIVGGCIAFIINIPMGAIEKRMMKPRLNKKTGKEKKLNKIFVRAVALVTSLILVAALLLAIVKLIVPEIINVIQLLIEKLPYLAEQIHLFLQSSEGAGQFIESILTKLESTELSFEEEAIKFVSNILSSSMSLVTSVISFVTDSVIALIFAAYLLMSKEKLSKQFDRMFQAYLSKKWYNRVTKFFRLAKNTFSVFISVQCFEATLLGLLCILGMFIFKMPYAVTVGVFVGVTALVPVVGAFLGIFVGAILILAVEPTKVIPFIIFVLVLQQIEGNFIYPKVVGDVIGLPGIWVLVAVSVGGSLLGLVGMLIGVPIASIIYTLLRTDIKDRLGQ